MYFFVSDKEHNRYSFRSRGTLLLDNMDNNTKGFEYFINNPQEVYQKILLGQEHINKYYTPIKVVDKWIELERIINEKSS